MKICGKIICEKKAEGTQDGKKARREQWKSPAEFVLSSLAFAVGLGNVWRFPYVCYVNGGGAFLVPYFLMLLLIGVPVIFMELSLAQYSASGPMTVWEVCPLFQGVGAGMLVIGFITAVYYNIIVAWAMYYFLASFQATLPWQGCNHPTYNTPYCYSKREAEPCESNNGTWFNLTCYNETYVSSFDLEVNSCNSSYCWNTTSNWVRYILENVARVSPSEEYFNHGVLDRSARMEDTGNIKWDICLVLLLVWIICFICISRGIKSSGKVVYFTATFPYVILTIILCFGATLPGSKTGIEFYIKPEWHQLATPKVWVDAAGQIFYSIGVSVGTLLTLASYNKFHDNVLRYTLIIGFGNCLTSFFAGFAIFAVLGFMAHELGAEVKDVVKSGSGLAFVAYPDIVTRLYPPQLWSALFFFMLLTLGLGSQCAMIESLMTAIIDLFPKLRPKRSSIAFVLCCILFLLGLPLCCKTGIYWLDLMTYYAGGWSFVILGLTECLIISWIYGARRLTKDIELMLGSELVIPWWLFWRFFSPLILATVFIFNIYEFTPLSYGDYLLPRWAQVVGWLMALTSLTMIPLIGCIKFALSYRNPEYANLTVIERLRKLTRPSALWKPSIERGISCVGTNDARVLFSENTGEANIIPLFPH